MSSSLFEAVSSGNLEVVKQSLASEGGMKELNSFNSDGETPVMVAVKGHQVTIAEALLKAGAGVNQGSKEKGTTEGYTALHFAARTNDADSVEMLLKNNADINRTSADGWSALHCACFSGHKQIVALLCKKPKIDVNVKNEHNITPLFFAASKGSVVMTRELLNAGAKVDLMDSQGDSVLHHTFAYQMQKLFEGGYDMPDAALDVGVVLAINGAPVDLKNAGNHTAFEFVNDDMPSYEDALKIISHNSSIFKKSSTEWNYMTFVSAGFDHYVGMGLALTHAVDLSERCKAMDKERIQSKKEKDAEKPAGGCPVMKSGSGRKRRVKKGGAPIDKDGGAPAGHGDMEIPADGSDPSGGQCPFFKKKKDGEGEATTAEVATKKVDTPHGEMEVPADGSDPTGGQCPFFKPKDGSTPAPTTTSSSSSSASQEKKTGGGGGSGDAPPPKMVAAPAPGDTGVVDTTIPGLWPLLYKNRETVLLILIAFFCGIWFEQMVAPMRSRGSVVQ